MTINYQTTPTEDLDLQAKANRETTVERPVTPQGLMRQVIVDYCRAVARENGSSDDARVQTWVDTMTPAQRAALVANQPAINTIIGR